MRYIFPPQRRSVQCKEGVELLISPQEISRFWSLSPPARVLHVGAHAAEELEDYLALGWGKESTVWVEALPEQVRVVGEKILPFEHHRVVQAVAWDKTGDDITFSVSSNIQSSSALAFADHLEVHPEITVVRKVHLTTTALSDLDIWSTGRDTFLNLDIQGAELFALRGMEGHLDECVAIYCEVNLRELYLDVPLLNELDEFLTIKGFTRVDQEIHDEYGWGDALYLPSSRLPSLMNLRRRLRAFRSRKG